MFRGSTGWRNPNAKKAHMAATPMMMAKERQVIVRPACRFITCNPQCARCSQAKHSTLTVKQTARQASKYPHHTLLDVLRGPGPRGDRPKARATFTGALSSQTLRLASASPTSPNAAGAALAMALPGLRFSQEPIPSWPVPPALPALPTPASPPLPPLQSPETPPSWPSAWPRRARQRTYWSPSWRNPSAQSSWPP